MDRYVNVVIAENPTFLELRLSEDLHNSLTAAFTFVLTAVSQNSPSDVAFFIKRNEKLLLFITQLVIQTYHLRKYSASFSEYFYGYTRVCKGTELSSTQKFLSLFLLVLLPSVKESLLTLKKSLQSRNSTRENVEPYKLRLCEAFQVAWFYCLELVFMLGKMISLIMQLRFALNLSRYPSFIFRVLGITYERIKHTDFAEAPRKTLFGRFLELLRLGLAFSALSFKVLEYFYSDEYREESAALKQKFSQNFPVPDAAIPSLDFLQTRANSYKSHCCFLCFDKLKKPVCLNSGYVFCLECAKGFVQETGYCPITKRPCGLENIHRIYEN